MLRSGTRSVIAIGTKELIRVADVSFLPTIRKEGTVFYNVQQQAGDALDILKATGCNTVRLYLWHTPISSSSSLQEVQTFASEIQDKGLKLWMVIHYSDTWAGPGNQEKPAAWGNASVPVLGDSVYNYKSLSDVSAALERLGTANDKDIMISETAYPFTLGWNDYTNNLVGEASHLLYSYPASSTGQFFFIDHTIND